MTDVPEKHEDAWDLLRDDANPYWGLREFLIANGDETKLRELLHERRAAEAKPVDEVRSITG
jgi:hypothetical protein